MDIIGAFSGLVAVLHSFGHVDAIPLCIFALAGFLSGATGFGFSGVGASLLVLGYLPAFLIPLLLSVSCFEQAMSYCLFRHQIADHGRIVPYVAGALFGILCGLVLLFMLPPTVVRLSLGVGILGYSAWALWRPRGAVLRGDYGHTASVAVGMLGGVTAGLAAFPGLPVVVWANLRGMGKLQFRSLVQPYVAVMQWVALLVLLLWYPAALTAETYATWVSVLPVVLVASALGYFAYCRMPSAWYARSNLAVLAVCGVALIGKSLAFG